MEASRPGSTTSPLSLVSRRDAVRSLHNLRGPPGVARLPRVWRCLQLGLLIPRIIMRISKGQGWAQPPRVSACVLLRCRLMIFLMFAGRGLRPSLVFVLGAGNEVRFWSVWLQGSSVGSGSSQVVSSRLSFCIRVSRYTFTVGTMESTCRDSHFEADGGEPRAICSHSVYALVDCEVLNHRVWLDLRAECAVAGV